MSHWTHATKFCLFAQSLFDVVALSHVVSDHRRYSADLEQGILEIMCKIKFSTLSSVEKKAEKLVTATLSNNETNGLHNRNKYYSIRHRNVGKRYKDIKISSQSNSTSVNYYTNLAEQSSSGLGRFSEC